MQAVIESKSGEYFKCILENGDLLNIHEDDFDDIVEVGDIISFTMTKSK